MTRRSFGEWVLCAATVASGIAYAQNRPAANSLSELRLRIVSSLPGKHRAAPAVIWLEPLADTPALSSLSHDHYTLLQKNRTFIPHLQVIPVGSVVNFPNEDPFFHNVFSLFEGKRFDLGLYEAGSSKSVTFSRVGVSYIFCNIHPEMSAVVIALNTPLYAIADAKDSVLLRGIPPGDYKLHFWIEGVPQPFLKGLSHPVHFSVHVVDLGVLKAPIAGARTISHTNMYGQEYAPNRQSPYSPY
jgi:plastocyanin